MHLMFSRIDILPKPRPDGRRVRRVQFRFRVSLNGMPATNEFDTYRNDDDGNDDDPPDGDPPSGGGGPSPRGDFDPTTDGDDAPQPQEGSDSASGGDGSHAEMHVPNITTALASSRRGMVYTKSNILKN